MNARKHTDTATSKAQWLKENLKPGEEWAGIIVGKNGAPDRHLILLPGGLESATWHEAKKFAAKSAGDLPTRREQSLLFANLKELFQKDWYWSGEQGAGSESYAWIQSFGNGDQLSHHEDYEYRVVLVRSIAI